MTVEPSSANQLDQVHCPIVVRQGRNVTAVTQIMPNSNKSTRVVESPSSRIPQNGPRVHESSHPKEKSKTYSFCLKKHTELIHENQNENLHETTIAPILTMVALQNVGTTPTKDLKGQLLQVGLLAGVMDTGVGDMRTLIAPDPRLFYNISTPSSMFICGSQGSGKSHTLSCILENCLTKSEASYLSNPLTGLVFHYDTFISDDGGSPCEAAFLSSCKSIRVRVLCSPTNIRTIKVLRGGYCASSS